MMSPLWVFFLIVVGGVDAPAGYMQSHTAHGTVFMLSSTARSRRISYNTSKRYEYSNIFS
jgi:hypothetical protein